MRLKSHPTGVFTPISELRRLEVRAALWDGEGRAVAESILRVKMARPAVSKHFRAVRGAGVVTALNRRRHRLCRLHAEGLSPVEEWAEVLRRYWAQQVDEIKNRAEQKALERMIRLDDGSHPKKEE